MSDQAQDAAAQAGQNADQSGEDYSWSNSDSNTTTMEEKGNEGLLGGLLNLDILPSPKSFSKTVGSSDSEDHSGADEGQ